MPTYVYLCKKGHRVEVFHSMKEAARKTCQQTGCSASATRVIEGANFQRMSDRFYSGQMCRDLPTKVFMTDRRKKRAQ